MLALGLIVYAGLLNSIDYFSIGMNWSYRGFLEFPIISPNPFVYLCVVLAGIIFRYDCVKKGK
jgi:hypothetical protein